VSASAAISGLIIAAPSSGSGKTLVTLGLLRHLSRSGVAIASAKTGPDYIDPAFHAAATGRPCFNLDPWAMRPETLAGSLQRTGEEADFVVCEGVMGLFDGAFVADGDTADGSTAHLAQLTGWPVVLVVDAGAQAGSAAAVVRGFASHREGVRVAGVIFNKVGSEAHARILCDAMAASLPDLAVLGCLPRRKGLTLPERHLGLVQASEHADLEAFLDDAADQLAQHVDMERFKALAQPSSLSGEKGGVLPPLGQRIAVAADQAFRFTYPLTLEGWRSAGAEIFPFSPLADEAPDDTCDAVYLPGGYPELHAGRLAANENFLDGLRSAAKKGKTVFGECGGYMVLGQGLVDQDGARHAMAGVLNLETSFAVRKLHLGYRQARLLVQTALGPRDATFRGHEFHYASVLKEQGQPLFSTANAAKAELGPVGLVEGTVSGSFIHLIDQA